MAFFHLDSQAPVRKALLEFLRTAVEIVPSAYTVCQAAECLSILLEDVVPAIVKTSILLCNLVFRTGFALAAAEVPPPNPYSLFLLRCVHDNAWTFMSTTLLADGFDLFG